MKRLDPSNRDAFALGPNTLQITLADVMLLHFLRDVDGQQLILKEASIQNTVLETVSITCNAT